MELVISAFFEVDPVDGKAVEQALRDVVEATRTEPGCISVDASRAVQPGLFHVYSRWVDDAAFEKHLELDHTKKYFEYIKPLVRRSSELVRMRGI